MSPALPSALVFCLILCHVRCQWVSFVNSSRPKENDISAGGNLKTSDGGWSPHNEGRPLSLDHLQTKSLSSVQSRLNESRLRRQAYFSKGNNIGAYSWSHRFTIPPVKFTSAESWRLREENVRYVKKMLEECQVDLLTPSGLRISLPVDNMNIRIVDFRLKVNEEFTNNDRGQYAPSSLQTGSVLVYDIPELQIQQDTKINYMMNVRFNKEATGISVEGVFEISPHKPYTGETTWNPSPITPITTNNNNQHPITNGPHSSIYSQSPANNFEQFGSAWNHSFEIINSVNKQVSLETAQQWRDEVEIFKNSLQDGIKFVFFNPTGLSISVPGDSENVKVLAFNIKLNEEFGALESGNFIPSMSKLLDGRSNYYYPNLKFKQGDKIHYWMRAIFGKQAFDSIVRGIYHISKGDPHLGGPVPPPSMPTRPTYFIEAETTTTTHPPPSQPGYPPPSQPGYPPTSPPGYPPTSLTDNQHFSEEQPSACQSLTLAKTNRVPIKHCPGQILFEHHFNSMEGWTHHIAIGGKNLEDEFTTFTQYKENIWQDQNRLYIKPTLLEDKYNADFVRSGTFIIPGCTIPHINTTFCHRKALGANILPPITSARIHTNKSLNFQYGTVEIRAKFPQGDWIVPELWLVPTDPTEEEKIVIGMARGNKGSTSYRLSAGVVRDRDSRLTLMEMKGNSPWFQGFHTFKLEWADDQVRFFVDNKQFHELPTGSSVVFRQEVFISLGVHVGGVREFPDDVFSQKPWTDKDIKRMALFWDAKDDWYPTWRSDSTLQVEFVRVTAL